MVETLKSKLKLIFLLLTACPFTISNCQAAQAKYIRVAILQDASSLRLKISGFYEVIDTANNAALYRGKNLNTTVTTYASGILLGNVRCKSRAIYIQPTEQDVIVIDGRRFRGNIKFVEKDNSRLLVINYIDLEGYLKGILYHEVSHYWPMEALRAQAIISRTYALYQMQQNQLKDFDLTNDTYSQVYGGLTSERYRTNKAVESTRGRIITFKDKIFPAYFHATCAGHTEDASLLWNIDMAPLKGVVCNFCKDSPHFNWHYVLSFSEISDKLNSSGYKIKSITDIVSLGKDASGRVADLKIVSQDKETKVSAKDFRNIIGPNIIRSTNFAVSIVKDDVIFEGVGWGHGVGLCQWGAYFMSKKGVPCEQILQYYYPGTKISLNP